LRKQRVFIEFTKCRKNDPRGRIPASVPVCAFPGNSKNLKSKGKNPSKAVRLLEKKERCQAN
jgi:hypothetical protein